MTLIRFLMEDGGEGENVTTDNSPASLIALNGGTMVYSATRGRHGMGIDYTSSTSGQIESRWDASAPDIRMSMRGWFWGPVNTPNDIVGLCNFRHSSGVCFRIQWNQSNSLIITPQSGSAITVATGLSLNSQYDLSVQAVIGTAGSVTATLRSVSGTQLGTVSSSNFNSGASAIVGVGTGIIGTYTTVYKTGWDEIALDDGGTTEIPLYTPVSNNYVLTDLMWTGSEWR